MFQTEFCPEPITAALIQINGNRSDMRKMQHRVVSRAEDGALQGATIRLKTKPACCGRARRAYPMISIPWLPRTAPIRVIKLRTNRIQCSRSTSAKVASGRELRERAAIDGGTAAQRQTAPR